MPDGTYDVVLRSPLGLRKGTLELSLKSGVLHGAFFILRKKNPIREGTVIGNTCAFSGIIATAAGEREYEATVTIIDDEIHGEVVFYLRTIPIKIPLLIPMKITGKRRLIDCPLK